MRKILLPITLYILTSSNVFAEIIVDSKGVDQQQYHADMYECQQLSEQVKDTPSQQTSVIGSTARGALLGAAGSAIAGGSGSDGAKVGAGIGLVGGGVKKHAQKENVAKQHELEKDQVMRNCLIGRGYTPLN